MPETLSRTTPIPITRTRVIPLPSAQMPLSRCMDQIAHQLDEFGIDTSSLHEVSQRLDLLTEQVRDAQCRKNTDAIPPLLKKAAMTMKEAGVILKMLIMVERGRIPPEVVEHLTRIRLYNDQTLADTILLLDAMKAP
jgi:hypothetical protein